MIKPSLALLLLACVSIPVRADVAENIHEEIVRDIAQSLKALAASMPQTPEPFVARGETDSWLGLPGDYDRAAADAEAQCSRSGPSARLLGDGVRFKSSTGKAVFMRMCSPDGDATANGSTFVLIDAVSPADALSKDCSAKGTDAKIAGTIYNDLASPLIGASAEHRVGICGYRPR
jgi:hypothetical protein